MLARQMRHGVDAGPQQQRAVEGEHQIVGFAWLGQAIAGARLQRITEALIAEVARHDHEGQARIALPQGAQEFHRPFPRHHQVGEHDIGGPLGKAHLGSVGAADRLDLPAGAFQYQGQHGTYRLVILDQ